MQAVWLWSPPPPTAPRGTQQLTAAALAPTLLAFPGLVPRSRPKRQTWAKGGWEGPLALVPLWLTATGFNEAPSGRVWPSLGRLRASRFQHPFGLPAAQASSTSLWWPSNLFRSGGGHLVCLR